MDPGSARWPLGAIALISLVCLAHKLVDLAKHDAIDELSKLERIFTDKVHLLELDLV